MLKTKKNKFLKKKTNKNFDKTFAKNKKKYSYFRKIRKSQNKKKGKKKFQ